MNFVETLNFSDDKDLLYLTDEEGIKIYETNNFQLLIKFNSSRIGLKGEVSNFQLFYSSSILIFSLIETIKYEKISQIIYNNSKIKKHHLILYDVNDFSILGKISMKNSIEINDFLVTKFFIILMIENKNKAILFKTSDLTYVKTITEVYSGKITYNDNFIDNENIKEKLINKNKCILAYIDYLKNYHIYLEEYLWNDDCSKILGFKTNLLVIDVNSSGVKQIDIVSPYLMVASSFGNKIHIFDLKTFNFKFCLFLGNFPYELSGIQLDNQKEILSIITNNKYLKLYKLIKLDGVCKCYNHDDGKISMNETRSIFENFMHNLKVGRNDFLCRYKINFNNNDMKDNKTLLYFDNSNDNKDEESIYLIQMNKTVTKLQFDKNKEKDMIVTEVITLPTYSNFQNNMKFKN